MFKDVSDDTSAEAVPYVHEEIAAEPYIHQEVPAEPYVHLEPVQVAGVALGPAWAGACLNNLGQAVECRTSF